MLTRRLLELKTIGAIFEVTISNIESNVFHVNLRHGKELIPVVNRMNEPVAYESLTQIYAVLECFGIHKASLLQEAPEALEPQDMKKSKKNIAKSSQLEISLLF